MMTVYWHAIKRLIRSTVNKRNHGNLLLVTGSPRSTTTALHNAFILSNLYRGIIADDLSERDPAIDLGLYTDEYYPSMKTAIAWCFEDRNEQKRIFSHELTTIISQLRDRFGVDRGLMLKAPHYVFGLRAYRETFPRTKVIFTHRSPFSIAFSMLKHPYISRQLPLSLDRCTDFLEFDLLHEYALPAALALAERGWQALSLFERALFVWHLYGRAFLLSRRFLHAIVIQNEHFGCRDIERIATLVERPASEVNALSTHYRALPTPSRDLNTLSLKGRELWDTIAEIDNTLSRMANER